MRRGVRAAAASIRKGASRLDVWRMIGALLDSRRALTAHADACLSPRGVLYQACERDPRLWPLAERIEDEHREILRSLDLIIAEANAADEEDQARADSLRAKVRDCEARLDEHERRASWLAQEAAYRELGGEG